MATATVLLCMNKAEARALMDIFDRVGGRPGKTRRGHTDNLRAALLAAGVEATADPRDISGTIMFSETK